MQTKWERLAKAVEARRRELMLSQAELAAKAGTSESTVRSIETARRDGYRASTLREIAAALGWSPGSLDAVYAGRKPTVVKPERESADVRTELARLRAEIADLRAAVESLTQRG